MEANKMISKQGFKWKCTKHPKVQGDFIYLDGDANDRVLCFNCVQTHSIPVSNLILMSQFLAVNEDEILQAYPPLKDQELSCRIREASQQQHLEEIAAYFKKLREDFEREVQSAEQRAKEELIKQENACRGLLEGYKRIAEIEKLKELIVSEKKSAEKDLDDFIKEKWRKAEENRKVMMNLIKQNESELYFHSEESDRIAEQITKSLKEITFFQQTLQQPQITLIKSTIGTSQSMEITKIDNSIYQVKQGTKNGNGDQVFIDPILDPLKKYILHIEVELKPGNSVNHFLFGLVRDEGKDKSQAYIQNMCYYDYCNSNGLVKYIKGSPMQSGAKVKDKHSFEIRIYLNEKFLRVSSLPEYSSIAELDDPNKINPSVAYRFFLSMVNPGDMMRIINIRTVSKFDEKM